MNGTETIAEAGPYPYTFPITATLIGYARCSTDRQDPAAQRQALPELGVAEDRIYTDHGLTAPPAPAPASTGWQGPSQMRAPSPIGFGNEA